nr:secretory phospholipase A2 receptor-like isoform X2 [Syngnathus scovelli]
MSMWMGLNWYLLMIGLYSTSSDKCGPGWLEYDSSCYKKGDGPNGWLGARHHCTWEGGDLVSINSSHEEQFVKRTMGKNTPFWLGQSNYYCKNISCYYQGGYHPMRWSDGQDDTYVNWEINSLRGYTEPTCAYVVQGARSQSDVWRAGSCGSSLAYLCKRPLRKPACPSLKGEKNASMCAGCPAGQGCSPISDGYVFKAVLTSQCDNDSFLYNGYCYHYEQKENKSWEDAETFCQARGGHLASFHSQAEGQFLYDHSTSVHWVGHRKKNNDNINSDGTICDYGLETEDYKLGECTVGLLNGAIGINQDCSIHLPFFCKRAKCGGPRQIPSLDIPGWTHKCGWWLDNPYNDFCYLINHTAMETWKDAEDACQSFGGNLLSIADSNEQSFINGIIKTLTHVDLIWLGAQIPLNEFSKWSDGSQVTYVNLKKQVRSRSTRNCLMLNGSCEWTFNSCLYERGYICKRIGQGKGVKQSLASDSANQCGAGWVVYGTSCYKKVEAPNGWLGARHHCFWEGGDLVSVNSAREMRFVMKTMGEETPFFWLGLSNLKCNVWCRFEGGKQRLTWSNGLKVVYENITYHHPWTFNVSSCAYVNQGGIGLPGMWRSGSCGSSLPYMCKRPLKCPAGQACSRKGDSYVFKAVTTSDCNDGNFVYGNHCYAYEKMYKSWEDAEKFCLTRGGHLVSVHSREEAKFVHDHARGWYPWLGLRKNNNTFEWSDGTDYDYKEWEGKKPVKCACPTSRGLLNDCPCTEERPFVCKTAKLRSFPQLPPLIGQAGWTDKCGWWLDGLSGDFCYLVDRWPKTWQEAENDCNRLGGNLLSIRDLPEQNFLHGYTKALAMDGNASLWLGARTPLNEDDSVWTDKSPWKKIKTVGGKTYSNQRCLSMVTGSGDWKVDKCDNKKDYICKKKGVAKKIPSSSSKVGVTKKIPSSSSKGVTSANRCGLGWLGHGAYCYKKVQAPNGWLGAWYHCVWEGGDLVSITSSAEEQFVKDIMGEKTPFWLGLSNLKCDVWCRFEGGKQRLTWSNGLKVVYKNITYHHPWTFNFSSCAYVNQGGIGLPGMWRSGSCGSSLPYMCKRPLKCPAGQACSRKGDSYVFKAVTTSVCNDGNFAYGNHCYAYEKMYKSWEDAEKFCLTRGGHLVSVHSREEAKFVRDHARGWYPWLGLRKNNNTFEWSDGTDYDYKEWEGKKPVNCACPTSRGLLNDCSCTGERPFVCKTAKLRSFPQLPPLIGQAGWTDNCGWWLDGLSGDFCYLVDRWPKTWQEAENDCNRLGGNLLSIRDLPEQNFLHGYTKALAMDGNASLWLGARTPLNEDDSVWTDKSPWKKIKTVGGDMNSNQSCLSMVTGNGDWKVDKCDNKKDYICKKKGVAKKRPSSSSKGVTSAIRCGLGWLGHGAYCYKKVQAPNGWLGAWYHCVWEGGDLVSITTSAEEQFVKDIIGEKTPFWLGLSNLMCDNIWCRFKGGSQKLIWSDGQRRSHTNWALNHTEITNVASCAYVNQGAWSQPGKWRSGSCGSSLAYVCKRPLRCLITRCDPKGDSYMFKAVATSDCNDGNFLYGDHCYNYQKMDKSWGEAEGFCAARGGHLASVHSKEEAQFVYDHSQSQRSPFVGLKNTTTDYKWSDGTAFDYKEWEKNTTKNTTGKCAFPNSVGQISACPCTEGRPFVCKTAKLRGPQKLPPLVGQLGWTSKCGWWLDVSSTDLCYLIAHQAMVTWWEAKYACEYFGGNLLSIANSSEQTIIHVYIKGLAIEQSLWLGANNTTKWIDGTPFTYSRWSAGKGGNCLSFITGSGHWKSDTCENQRGYICKKRGYGKKWTSSTGSNSP